MTEEQIEQHLAAVPEWRRTGDEIGRDWQFADFKTALAFINRVGEVADALDHHPDILLHGWNKVRLSITTHDAGGLTEQDFRLAAQVDQLG